MQLTCWSMVFPLQVFQGAAPPGPSAFAQPAFGTVAISWAANHGIQDLSVPANPFDATRAGATWTYNLLDQVPPVIVARLLPPERK